LFPGELLSIGNGTGGRSGERPCVVRNKCRRASSLRVPPESPHRRCSAGILPAVSWAASCAEGYEGRISPAIVKARHGASWTGTPSRLPAVARAEAGATWHRLGAPPPYQRSSLARGAHGQRHIYPAIGSTAQCLTRDGVRATIIFTREARDREHFQQVRTCNGVHSYRFRAM